jgi:hypothetical protein
MTPTNSSDKKGKQDTMVDYDTAVSIVQDSDADPIMLAKVAYENPDFGANVAANPRAYPGLKRWIAEFGDDRARETLKAMGFEVPDRGVSPRAATEQQTSVKGEQASYGSNQQAQQPQSQSAMVHIADQRANGNQYAPVNSSAAQTPIATNTYGYTAEQALDPNTDQMTIARIAQYAPELRPCLARNPNTYPELLNWLAQLHDPAVDAALATRQ